jgi:hypothetical protein
MADTLRVTYAPQPGQKWRSSGISAPQPGHGVPAAASGSGSGVGSGSAVAGAISAAGASAIASGGSTAGTARVGSQRRKAPQLPQKSSPSAFS